MFWHVPFRFVLLRFVLLLTVNNNIENKLDFSFYFALFAQDEHKTTQHIASRSIRQTCNGVFLEQSDAQSHRHTQQNYLLIALLPSAATPASCT